VVAVLIGSTGAGKSTLMNSLAGARISSPGAVRPTTRHPIVWTHLDHAARYDDDYLTGYGTAPDAARRLEVVQSDHPLLADLTVIDAPDIDSVEEVHRTIADELLAVADVCVFVTSAQRYADAVPWEFLRRARDRGVAVLFVLNRLPDAVAADIASDYRRRLEAGRVFGPGDELVLIREQPIDPTYEGLPGSAVAPILTTLTAMSGESHRSVVVGAVRGAISDVGERALRLATLIDQESGEIAGMRDVVERAYADQAAEIEQALDDGTLIRAEVIRRWQEVIGTGELLKAITEGAGVVTAWFRRVFGGVGVATERVGREAEDELVATIIRRTDVAATTSATGWEAHPGGRALVTDAALWRHDSGTPGVAQQALDQWIAGLAALVEDAAADKIRWARAASLGVNAVAVTLIITVFVHTSGLSGAEVGVAAGAAAVQQRLLEHLFGTAAARSLAVTARTNLLEAMRHVLRTDAGRFHRILDGMGPGDALELKAAHEAVRSALRRWDG